MARKANPQQLRLLPTVAEIRQQKQARADRAARPSILCWQCRQHKPPGEVEPHPETLQDVCQLCWDKHPKFYDAWLARKTRELEESAP